MRIKLIQVYASTAKQEEEEIDQFCEIITMKVENWNIMLKILMKNLNKKIDRETEDAGNKIGEILELKF